MSNKFKIEYYHKIPQTTSPYLQLIQAKKKIYGYKYELIRNEKSNSQNHNRSMGQPPSQVPHKHSKTQSNQKQKPKTQKNNSRKKRSHTQQVEDRLHQSLFLNRDVEPKQAKHQATKSLFTSEGLHDQSINPHQFMKNYKNLLQQQDRNVKSFTQHIQSKGFSRERPTYCQSNPLQKLQINEIDDLINLIDHCVQEANDYIGYLTGKIQILRNENALMRQQQLKILKIKDGMINQKEVEIDRLKKQLHSHHVPKHENEKTFQIKKLLEIIDKMTEQNTNLKTRLKQFEQGEPRNFKDYLQKEKKDIYNEIHNKIDILNISIDKKSHEHLGDQDPSRQSKKGKNNKPKFYK